MSESQDRGQGRGWQQGWINQQVEASIKDIRVALDTINRELRAAIEGLSRDVRAAQREHDGTRNALTIYEERQKQLLERLSGIERRLEQVDQRLDGMERTVETIRPVRTVLTWVMAAVGAAVVGALLRLVIIAH